MPELCSVTLTEHILWIALISIDYILDYVKDAINGCNPDVEGKLNANLFCF